MAIDCNCKHKQTVKRTIYSKAKWHWYVSRDNYAAQQIWGKHKDNKWEGIMLGKMSRSLNNLVCHNDIAKLIPGDLIS